MIPTEWHSMLANHLWQSTAVAGVAGLLAFALRKNQARVRYWIWLTASIKFLIPFSVLIALGQRLSMAAATPVVAPRFSAMFEQVTQVVPELPDRAVAASSAAHATQLVPLLLGTWLIGGFVVAFIWICRWTRVHAAMRAGVRLAANATVPVISTPALLEPGIFGIFRPVLLLPAGITEHLTGEHLATILAHELCHVRRRDNLAAAIHMLVETVFWFHPLVWWIGSRLVDERERACDEEVLRSGNAPAIYAESILKTCQFYLESPLACVSGITGSDLKKRIVRIMTEPLLEKFTLSRKMLLASVAAAIVAGPVLFGLSKQETTAAQSPNANAAPLPSFEVASVKPNRSGDRRVGIRNSPGTFSAVNVTPKMLIEFAYNIRGTQLSGGPSWIDSEHFDIEAKTGESAEDTRGNPARFNEQRRLMLRSLLADRFKLVVNQETKDLPIYDLLVAKGGPKFHETTQPPIDPNSPPPPPSGPPQPGQPLRGRGIMMGFSRGQLMMNGGTMSQLAQALSERVGRNVIDKTDLKGEYDLSLQWTPEENDALVRSEGGGPDGRPPGDAAPPPDSGPTLFTALQEQLGLKLESAKGPVLTYTIVSIERPSEN
jgi:uncharacterized protein (TIGR03435 family)